MMKVIYPLILLHLYRYNMITVVGGVYRELVTSPFWDEVYGSAGRAALAIKKLGGEVLLKSQCGPHCKASIESTAFHEGFECDLNL